ncbi:MAG: glutamyl-tRNA reductase [Firmicutes bacterium]|nr:glutamyl-tRNA reductase [Bacillota bacterium]
MHIVAIGINYRSATVDIREPFSVSAASLQTALSDLMALPSIEEAVLVSTCNRTEVYAVTADVAAATHDIESFYADLSGLSRYSFGSYLYRLTEYDAVGHLLRVVVGMDSMVVGETQILGQVRSAFLAAQSFGATGPVFNHLFRNAVAFAKRAQTETGIGQSAVSVSYAAASLAKKVFSTLADKTALIIGAGKMAELTLTHLRSQGIDRVLVVNRTFSRAMEVAARFEGEAYPLENLPDALARADIVISSTGARGYVLTPEVLSVTHRKRKRRPLFCVDIAVPRDVDPALASLDEVYVYDIDDLQDVVSSGVAMRQKEAQLVQEMIDEEVAAFARWVTQQNVTPLITQLRERTGQIQSSVLDSLANKLPELDEREWKVIQKHVGSIVNQLLRDPIATLKDSVNEPGSQELVQAFARIFNLSTVESDESVQVANPLEEMPVFWKRGLSVEGASGVREVDGSGEARRAAERVARSLSQGLAAVSST